MLNDLLSFDYAVYVVITAALFQVSPGRLRPLLLSFASLLLYGFYSPVSATVLLFASIGVFLGGRALDAEVPVARRRMLTAAILIALLSYLLLIKLLPILHEHGRALSTEQFLLALGVSYYIFKLMGYTIDVYWRKYPAWTDPIRFIAFTTFFPQLPAGPIQRASEFELPDDGNKTSELMRVGLRRILLGVVKKTVVADQLGVMIAHIDGQQPQYPSSIWIAACLFAFQIYFDFAALTDIANGTAALFGIRSPENFAHPFLAPSITQFWRRWNMTLTFWLTDYVFTPLRMATRNLGKWGLVLSLTVTMVLIGLWHGLRVGFLLFGLIHSGYLIVDALTATARRRFYRTHLLADKLTGIMGPFLVFSMMAFALIFFRAATLPNIRYQLQHLWDGILSPVASLQLFAFGIGRLRCGMVLITAFGLEFWEYFSSAHWQGTLRVPQFSDLPWPLRWASYYSGLAIAATLHQQSVHFIYVQF
jgi:alginate O-acetyltransferase complex protein AlgI